MTKLIVLVGFVLSFAAGLLTGSRFMPPPPRDEEEWFRPSSMNHGPDEGATTRPGGGPMMHRGFLPRELNLTADQQTKMREIWSKVGINGPREMDEKRHELGEAKDEQFSRLISPDKMADFQKIKEDFTTKMTALDTEFRDSFDNAVKQTEALLTDEQRQKYEAIRNRMQPPHDGFGHGPDDEGFGHGPGGHGHHGPMMGPMGGFDGGPGGPPPGQ